MKGVLYILTWALLKWTRTRATVTELCASDLCSLLDGGYAIKKNDGIPSIMTRP